MRLYLNAESKNGIGYTPDWLKVFYTVGGDEYTLTLDIRGWIDYDNEGLNCRCKGELVPWVLYNHETGDEHDLSELPEDVVNFTSGPIANIICNGNEFTVGVYPVNDSDENMEMVDSDILSNGTGSFEMYVDGESYEKEFEFDVEVNL